LAVSTWRQLDSVEQVLMMLLQQQTEQMKRQQHLPSNQLKTDQVEEVEMEYAL
jgi:predicted metal-dependent hydrolase